MSSSRQGRLAWLVLGAALVSAVAVAAEVHAQGFDLGAIPAQKGEEATRGELEAWRLALMDKNVDAREAAEKVVKKNPRSYVGHFVLGWVQHYGEANFPRALYDYDRALQLFEQRWGKKPGPHQPWRWHARLLRELAATQGDLEHYGDRLRIIKRYNALYQPKMIAERSWTLMKMRRYDAARRAAHAGLASGDPQQRDIALNALCAIEFEAGRDGKSYVACRKALDNARADGGQVDAVDLTNFAEASRSLFKLDEAERILLEATKAPPAWYGNPWMELAELYTREARFPEALNALREIPPYRAQRPPHVRDSDRNESRRALAEFFVVIGRPWDAMRITAKAMVSPDRRSHNSRDPAQDRAIVALLDRRARRLGAQMLMEKAIGRPFYDRLWTWGRASMLRLQGWMSGRAAEKLLGDPYHIVGIFRIGTARSAIMPPWLVGELVQVAGAGVVRQAVKQARARDNRHGAKAYYDAFEAEAALSEGDYARALSLGASSAVALGRSEAMLAARSHAIAAEAARRLGRWKDAAAHYDAAFQRDPGVFRRLDLEVPVRFEGNGGPVAEATIDALGESPRLDDERAGLEVRVEADPAGGTACLLGSSGDVLGCGRVKAKAHDDVDSLGRRLALSFEKRVFDPRIDLSQTDANSLDGSNRAARDPLHTLFDHLGPMPNDDTPSGGGGTAPSDDTPQAGTAPSGGAPPDNNAPASAPPAP